jgi:hypothetical protein
MDTVGLLLIGSDVELVRHRSDCYRINRDRSKRQLTVYEPSK